MEGLVCSAGSTTVLYKLSYLFVHLWPPDMCFSSRLYLKNAWVSCVQLLKNSSDMPWESQLFFPIAHNQPLCLTHFTYCDRAVKLVSPYLTILVKILNDFGKFRIVSGFLTQLASIYWNTTTDARPKLTTAYKSFCITHRHRPSG